MMPIENGSMEDYHCIVCDAPLEGSDFLGTIMGMTVSLCREHAEDCNRDCSKCAMAGVCEIKHNIHKPYKAANESYFGEPRR